MDISSNLKADTQAIPAEPVAVVNDVRGFWMNVALGLKDELAIRGNRIEELETALIAANKRIAQLEGKPEAQL